jgi:hypothetical protein
MYQRLLFWIAHPQVLRAGIGLHQHLDPVALRPNRHLYQIPLPQLTSQFLLHCHIQPSNQLRLPDCHLHVEINPVVFSEPAALKKRLKRNRFDDIEELLGISDKQKAEILSINKAHDPGRVYKDLWICLSPSHSKVYRLETSLEEYLAYTSDQGRR